MYTTITARVIDQTLQITNIPKLASGGENDVRVEVSFDSLWSGFGKTAIFYRKENQVYHVVMVSDTCLIPREVLAEPGKLYFGILGTSGATVRTTEVVTFNVVQGAITAGVSQPLPDVYRQLMSEYGVLSARVNNLAAGGSVDDGELLDVRVAASGKTYDTAGDSVRGQYANNRDRVIDVESRFTSGENKIDCNAVERGYYYQHSDGALVNSADSYSTPFIPCDKSEDWTMYGVAHVTIWDVDRVFLRGFVCSAANNYVLTFNTGEGAAYIRVGIVGLTPKATTLGKSVSRVPRTVHTPVLKNSALDEKQFERKRFIESMQAYRYPVSVTWAIGGMNSVGEDAVTTYSNITNYFSVPSCVGTFTVESANKPIWVVGYDSTRTKVYDSSDWSNAVDVANTCAYYRVAQNHGEDYGLAWADEVEIYFDLMSIAGEAKGAYQEGFIPFTVPVNQKIASGSAGDTETIVNVDCVLKLPITYSPTGRTTKLLMICHGAGRGVTGSDNWCEQSSYLSLIDTFVNAGYAVFDCNGYGNDALGWNHWGCHRALEAYRKAYDYVVRNYNVESNLSIYGFSMGGLTAFNLVFQHFPNVKCLAAGSPVLNLKEMCWDGGVGTAFTSAYGMSTTTYEAEKTVGCDPIQNICTVADAPYVFDKVPPVKIWFGSTENGANGGVNRQNAVDIVAAIHNANGVAYYREVAGAGHEICYGANLTVNKEILLWLNRFNA